jgi:class 3 adenylate cyclase
MTNFPASFNRSLMAVLFTDAVGFSTRASENEEAAHRLLTQDFEVMSGLCAKHSGRLVKSTGDGLLMSFDSAAQAVDCAMDIQRTFAQRPPAFLKHRIGLHLCDAITEDGDVHGDGVNVASRLESLASPGGICLSQSMYEMVRNRLPVQARSLGQQHLKNLMEPVTVYEISPNNAPKVHRINEISPVAATHKQQTSMAPVIYWIVGAIAFLGICILVGALFLGNKMPERRPLPGEPGFVPRGGLQPGDPGFRPRPGALPGEPGYVPRPGDPGFRGPRPGEPGFVPPPGARRPRGPGQGG